MPHQSREELLAAAAQTQRQADLLNSLDPLIAGAIGAGQGVTSNFLVPLAQKLGLDPQAVQSLIKRQPEAYRGAQFGGAIAQSAIGLPASKLAQIGAGAARAGAFGTGESLTSGSTLPEALKTGSKYAALGGVTSTVPVALGALKKPLQATAKQGYKTALNLLSRKATAPIIGALMGGASGALSGDPKRALDRAAWGLALGTGARGLKSTLESKPIITAISKLLPEERTAIESYLLGKSPAVASKLGRLVPQTTAAVSATIPAIQPRGSQTPTAPDMNKLKEYTIKAEDYIKSKGYEITPDRVQRIRDSMMQQDSGA